MIDFKKRRRQECQGAKVPDSVRRGTPEGVAGEQLPVLPVWTERGGQVTNKRAQHLKVAFSGSGKGTEMSITK